jgi:uncharacterized protein YggU (UPF0235/DUF167 family)
MMVSVKVFPKAGRNEIREQPDGSLNAFVKPVPEGGKANQEAIRLLARHFSVRMAGVRLVSGARSKKKAFEVNFGVK